MVELPSTSQSRKIVRYLRRRNNRPSNFIDFTFGGSDETEEASGEGEATLDGDLLTFELWHHDGDEYTFDFERRR